MNKAMLELSVGDQVRVFLDENWFKGVIVKIEPYSQHRSFYWVNLAPEAQEKLHVGSISVFNPKHIQRVLV